MSVEEENGIYENGRIQGEPREGSTHKFWSGERKVALFAYTYIYITTEAQEQPQVCGHASVIEVTKIIWLQQKSPVLEHISERG